MNREVTFVNVKAKKITKTGNSLFNYNNKTNLRSEEVGMEYYKINGYNAKISENGPWIELFYRLFKKFFKKTDINDKFKTKCELILDNDFYKEYEIEINAYLNKLKNQNLSKIVFKDTHKKFNKNIIVLLDYLTNNQILSIIKYLIEDFIHNKKGFPDLMIWNEKELFFCEVKSESDSLSRKQIAVHKLMLENNIKIEILTINKTIDNINRENNKYQKEFKPNKKDYIARYQNKINTAESVLNQFKELNFDIKSYIHRNNPNYVISYLNAVNKLKIKTINEFNNQKEDVKKLALKNEKKIEFLKIMSEGKRLEDKKRYDEAIETYNQLTDNPHKHVALKRICMCYRKTKEYEKELDLIFKCINDETFNRYKKDVFKRRLKQLINPKRNVKTFITTEKCPKCGNKLNMKYLVSKNIKFIMCEKCYWYGGVK